MLFKYFELVFLQLQLVKISCKLITIRLSYKKKEKGWLFYETFTSNSVKLLPGYLSHLQLKTHKYKYQSKSQKSLEEN